MSLMRQRSGVAREFEADGCRKSLAYEITRRFQGSIVRARGTNRPHFQPFPWSRLSVGLPAHDEK
jgi:hypothetical protein